MAAVDAEKEALVALLLRAVQNLPAASLASSCAGYSRKASRP